MTTSKTTTTVEMRNASFKMYDAAHTMFSFDLFIGSEYKLWLQYRVHNKTGAIQLDDASYATISGDRSEWTMTEDTPFEIFDAVAKFCNDNEFPTPVFFAIPNDAEGNVFWGWQFEIDGDLMMLSDITYTSYQENKFNEERSEVREAIHKFCAEHGVDHSDLDELMEDVAFNL
jgi:hypothetical protein